VQLIDSRWAAAALQRRQASGGASSYLPQRSHSRRPGWAAAPAAHSLPSQPRARRPAGAPSCRRLAASWRRPQSRAGWTVQRLRRHCSMRPGVSGGVEQAVRSGPGQGALARGAGRRGARPMAPGAPALGGPWASQQACRPPIRRTHLSRSRRPGRQDGWLRAPAQADAALAARRLLRLDSREAGLAPPAGLAAAISQAQRAVAAGRLHAAPARKGARCARGGGGRGG
jgi:hypothetical protein